MNKHDGNVFFLGDFDDHAEDEITVPLIREIEEQRKYRDGRIDLWINSFGGYAHLVYSLVALVELAKREGVIVRTIVPNIAFSAGSMLAIAGTPGHRYIEKTGTHLIHYGTTIGTAESTPQQIERWSAFKKRDFNNTLAHYRKYAKPSLPLDTEMLDDGWSIPANKCITYGLADKYMDKLDISGI